MVRAVGFAEGRFLPFAVLLVAFVLDLELGLAVLFCVDDFVVVWLDFADEDLALDDAVF
jgi:hypothetical protein